MVEERRIIIHKDTSTILKGICAIFILVNHIVSKGKLINNLTALSMFHRLSDLGMMGFLMISGYGLFMSYKSKGLDHYWENKFRKLIPPILIANVLGMVIHLVFMSEPLSRAEIYDGLVLRNVYYPIFDSELWYIHLLMAWYVLFYLNFWLIKKSKLQMLALGVVTMLMWYFTPEVYGLSNVYCLAFPIGVFTAYLLNYYTIPQVVSRFVDFTLFLCGIISYGFLVLMDDQQMKITGYKINFWLWTMATNLLLMLSVITLLIISVKIAASSVKDIFMWLGNVSLLLYVFQRPLILEWMEYNNNMTIRCVGGVSDLYC